ncbi:hypothetical protein ALO_14467 [Acetonema longum DSM 6540]|uniref:Uncharacterized protein n=1 Tax=Acetonema longum DSM 6540 TaxID=1009370 RepID=F7NLC1_9FIRM|nr:hypothetical protein ALO_14467 [Acetonema longum DSM 6540]
MPSKNRKKTGGKSHCAFSAGFYLDGNKLCKAGLFLAKTETSSAKQACFSFVF